MINDDYSDIINLPRHESRSHKKMSNNNRAAQFMPFAALQGFTGLIEETKRQTVEKIELDEQKQVILNEKITEILNVDYTYKLLKIKYFQKDSKKKGGNYIISILTLKKIDEQEKKLIFQNGQKIAIDDIIEIDFYQ